MSKGFTIPTVFTALDRMTKPLQKMQSSIKNFEMQIQDAAKRNEKLFSFARRAAITSALIAAPLILAANSAVQFEDAMADVAKTTGVTGKELDKLGSGILSLAPGTRTSIKELQKIAAIGGQMGVVKDQILDFTDAGNKFNVALGSDFSGGVEEATKAISGLRLLFEETRNLKVADAITKTGSAINALSSKGINVPELAEFTSRVGALPEALKPSIQNTLALGAAFNKANIASEIASRAFMDIILTAGSNLPQFAKQMNLSAEAASKLLNTDQSGFAVKFSESLKGLTTEKLATTLKKLRIMDAGAVKLVGALASSVGVLSEYQKISNGEFAKGTSLLNEYNVKNETTRAKLERAMNAFQALGIVIGTELIPIINKLLARLLPMLKSFINWAKEHKTLIKVVLIFIGVLSLLSMAISVATTAMAVFDVIAAANPIGLITLAVLGLVTAFILLADWIDSLRPAFHQFNIKFSEWCKDIGSALLIYVMMPVKDLISVFQELTELLGMHDVSKSLSKVGKDIDVFIAKLQKGIAERDRLHHGASTTWDEKNSDPVPALNSKSETEQQQIAAMRQQAYNSTLTILNGSGGRVKLDNDNPAISIMPTVGSTHSGWQEKW
jgi:TP901 family phage tail tape measure protein